MSFYKKNGSHNLSINEDIATKFTLFWLKYVHFTKGAKFKQLVIQWCACKIITLQNMKYQCVNICGSQIWVFILASSGIPYYKHLLKNLLKYLYIWKRHKQNLNDGSSVLMALLTSSLWCTTCEIILFHTSQRWFPKNFVTISDVRIVKKKRCLTWSEAPSIFY